jgi:hypothetical protein
MTTTLVKIVQPAVQIVVMVSPVTHVLMSYVLHALDITMFVTIKPVRQMQFGIVLSEHVSVM